MSPGTPRVVPLRLRENEKGTQCRAHARWVLRITPRTPRDLRSRLPKMRESARGAGARVIAVAVAEAGPVSRERVVGRTFTRHPRALGKGGVLRKMIISRGGA